MYHHKVQLCENGTQHVLDFVLFFTLVSILLRNFNMKFFFCSLEFWFRFVDLENTQEKKGDFRVTVDTTRTKSYDCKSHINSKEISFE